MSDDLERYTAFWEAHKSDFDQFGNYIPNSQIDGDLREARATITALTASLAQVTAEGVKMADAAMALGFQTVELKAENAKLREALKQAEGLRSMRILSTPDQFTVRLDAAFPDVFSAITRALGATK